MLEPINEVFASPQTDDLEKVYEFINGKKMQGAEFMEAFDQMLDAPEVFRIWDAFCVELKERLEDELDDEDEFMDSVTEVLEKFCDSHDNSW